MDRTADRVALDDDPQIPVSNPKGSQNSVPDPYLSIPTEPTMIEILVMAGESTEWKYKHEADLDVPDGQSPYAIDYGVMPYKTKESQDAIAQSGILPILNLYPKDTTPYRVRVPAGVRRGSATPPRHKRGRLLQVRMQDMDREVERLLGTPRWSGPAFHRTYKRGSRQGPRSSRARYWCPKGCWAAREAERLHHLDWHTVVTLKVQDADWVEFGKTWARINPLGKLDAMGRGFDTKPYYIGTVAIGPEKGGIHVHMVIGGGNRNAIRDMLERWPWPGVEIQDCYAPFGAIHYALSQSVCPKLPKGTEGGPWILIKTQHRKPIRQGGGDAILQYFDSGVNLDLRARLLKAQIDRTNGRRARDGQTLTRRQEIARLGGLAKAANARARKSSARRPIITSWERTAEQPSDSIRPTLRLRWPSRFATSPGSTESLPEL